MICVWDVCASAIALFHGISFFFHTSLLHSVTLYLIVIFSFFSVLCVCFGGFFRVVVVVWQQIPDVSPTGRYTTLVPLLFILAVSATKEIVEDVVSIILCVNSACRHICNHICTLPRSFLNSICLFAAAAAPVRCLGQQQKRHKADQETNKRQVEVLRDGQWLWLAWQQINVGDVVRVRAGAFFPADLILISSRYNFF